MTKYPMRWRILRIKKAAIKAAKPEEQQRFLKAVASQGM